MQERSQSGQPRLQKKCSTTCCSTDGKAAAKSKNKASPHSDSSPVLTMHSSVSIVLLIMGPSGEKPRGELAVSGSSPCSAEHRRAPAGDRQRQHPSKIQGRLPPCRCAPGLLGYKRKKGLCYGEAEEEEEEEVP
ncbi:unnamed protein product [Prorocentrum cordatum]|uniref:Uncharacterized protein n=1 Tax=Prorocentrum cordatum TaxID=2364126 RepID=A0ABN9WQT8_9DINO|nr:unnamed protein product [Polarella glacialis]